MKKCAIQNLALNITDICNLNCAHCLMGKKEMKSMRDEVIEATLNQIHSMGTLSICGGEITYALDRLEKVINYVIENKIPLEYVTMTINATNYSEELLRLLDEINSYIGGNDPRVLFAISYDKYHLAEMKKLDLIDQFVENVDKYIESKYFLGIREIKKKLIREGNATSLDNSITVPLRPPKYFITYVNHKGKFDKNGLCNIGPVVTISPEGIITECDASNYNQKTIYNYGNVLNGSIEEQILNNKAIILKPRQYTRSCYKELKRFHNYNK